MIKLSGLYEINRRLKYIESLREHEGNDDGADNELDPEPGGIGSESDDEQPPGPFPEPPFRCYVVVFTQRIKKCKIVLTEYKNTNHLIFDYEFDYGDSGGFQRRRVVCDKTKLSDEVKLIHRVAKGMTQKTAVSGVHAGKVLVDVEYIQSSVSHNSYWLAKKSVLLERNPPAFDKRFNVKISQTCVEFDHTVNIFQRFETALNGNTMNLVIRRPTGPEESPP